MNLKEIKEGIINNNRRAIAKAITLIEENDERIGELIDELKDYSGYAKVFGITGPPGVGKSSLISKLIKVGRNRGDKIGILVIDPTSPISGGALLGNRIRMIDASTDEEIYIRSFATRGWVGGLARSIDDAILILEASGKNIIFIETVGAGQIETEISKKADVVNVVLMPYSGDEIQAMKAGLMEIADIITINKIDLDKVGKIEIILKMIFADTNIKIVKSSALYNEGINEVYDTMLSKWEEIYKSGELENRRRTRIKSYLIEELLYSLNMLINNFVKENKIIEDLVDLIYNKKIGNYEGKIKLKKEFLEKLKNKQLI